MRLDTLELLGLGPGEAPEPPAPEIRYWYHTDHLGTPYVLTDTLKVVQWKISLDPFGETVSEETPVISDNLRFPGQIADRASLLNYNWNRYYQPKIGRYYQVDVMDVRFSKFNESLVSGNSYSYVENNPVKFSDPSGLFTYKSDKHGKPLVPPVSPQLYKLLTCIESCIGSPFVVTSTSEIIPEHAGINPHTKGEAADVRYSSTNPYKFLCCASKCNAGNARDEKKHPSRKATGPHLHVQIGPSIGGSRGDLPPKDCDPCKKNKKK